MAVKGYRGLRVLSFFILLAASLLRDRPPPRLPGNAKWTVNGPVCPKDKIKLIRASNGKLRCQKCGKLFDPPKHGN
jgi:hypothetical protein